MTEQRKPWEDRFRVPTMSELRADLPDAPGTKILGPMVEFLDGLGCQSEVRWFGPGDGAPLGWPTVSSHTENIVGLIVPSQPTSNCPSSDQAFVKASR